MKKTILKTAVVATLGAVVAMPAQAAVNTFNYNGFFTMLDTTGAALANNSLTAKGANQFQTSISGTLSFDTVTGAGTGTMLPFDFFSNDPALPVEASSMNLQAIGDGVGGSGSLVLGNMLFNWNGNNGIPVSIVLDAQGFFAGALDGSGGLGAVPASDGTYTNSVFGYLGLGPVPIATTAFNTTIAPGCDTGCINVNPSGLLPLLLDTALNTYDITANTGGTIGGSPMVNGPVTGFNANFDITSLIFTSNDPGGSIDPFPVSAVPVPAAAWLFGSGLLGLFSIARRRSLK